jgi:4-hydroxy-tetrahydrodipicolinate reductase
MTRIGIAGAGGRMGKMLINRIIDYPNLELTAAIECEDSPVIGLDPGILGGTSEFGFLVVSDLGSVLDSFDLLIDFTNVESTLENVTACRAANKRAVVGTTGLSGHSDFLKEASFDIPIMFAPNMSIGVNVCFQVLNMVATALGDDYDIEIVESHHRGKVDAPSGTALKMGEIIAEALGRDLSDCAIFGREGITGSRENKTIGFETIRAGDIVGEHTALFAGTGERIEITHRASDRVNFANGALRAADWLMGKEKGLYDMIDVLGLR